MTQEEIRDFADKELEGNLPASKFNKHLHILKSGQNYAKKHKKDFQNGLDFGCGYGFGLTISKSLGISMTGLETQECREKVSESLEMLKNKEHKVIIRDTDEIPWTEFVDNEFDFMLARWSIWRKRGDDEGVLNKRLPNWMNLRIKELARITKTGGIWLIYPGQWQAVIKRAVKSLVPEKKLSVVYL